MKTETAKNRPSSLRYGLALAWLCLLYASQASADVLPPEVDACRNKKAGDHCESGTCRKSTCSRIDYENWDRDGGAIPPPIVSECLVCKADTKGSAGTDAAGSDAAGSAAAGRDSAGRAAAGTHAADGGGSGSADAKNESSGCNALGSREASHVGALAFAALAGLLTQKRRRNR